MTAEPAGSDTITLEMTCVSRPVLLGHNREGDVISGIRKRRLNTGIVAVTRLNIDGDGQADLRVHGGADKAIYCYPAEHLTFWRQRIRDLRPDAPFGENLRTRGIDETIACIGDRWRWGNVLLEISQPRWPCYKLAMHTDRPMIIREFVEAGRCGWYFRVIAEGTAPTTGKVEVEYRDPQRITVEQAFSAARGDIDPDLLGRVNEHPALAAAWRR